MMYDNYDDEMVAVLQLHLIKVGVYHSTICLSKWHVVITQVDLMKFIRNDQWCKYQV